MREIERKFLLKNIDDIDKYIVNSIIIEQCYIKIDDYEEIRIRRTVPTNCKSIEEELEKTRYYLTTKRGNGIDREELEESISKDEFYELKSHRVHKHPIFKKRYYLENRYKDIIKEIVMDDYENVTTRCHLHPINNFKDKIMEIEYIDREYSNFIPQEYRKYIKRDVTNDIRFKNRYIAMNYFNK